MNPGPKLQVRPDPKSKQVSTPDPMGAGAATSMPANATKRPPTKPHRSNLWRWIKWIALAVLAVGALLYATRNLLLGTPVTTVAVVRGDLVQTIVASGRVATPQRVAIGTELTGRVDAIPVDEGQHVTRGQLLIQLNDDDERAALAQADAGIAQASAKLGQIRDVALPAAQQSLRQTQSNLTQAQQQFARTEEMTTRGAFSKAQLDDVQRNLDVAKSQLQAAQIQVRASSAGGSDYVLAESALQQANAIRQAAQARLDATRILAPADGILIARNVERGHVATAGKDLMVLAPTGLTQIVVQIDEKNLSLLSVGESAIGSADAYADQRFDATVSYINPGIDPLRGAVEVKLDVPEPPAYLKQDMTASIDIEVARRNATLIAPDNTIRDADSGKPWVMLLRNQRVQKQAVKLGLTGTGQVEVLEGVAVGDLLIPTSNLAIKVGQHVRTISSARPKQ
jgi:HlyD family secretion protein